VFLIPHGSSLLSFLSTGVHYIMRRLRRAPVVSAMCVVFSWMLMLNGSSMLLESISVCVCSYIGLSMWEDFLSHVVAVPVGLRADDGAFCR
jgi:hypothetical protein